MRDASAPTHLWGLGIRVQRFIPPRTFAGHRAAIVVATPRVIRPTVITTVDQPTRLRQGSGVRFGASRFTVAWCSLVLYCEDAAACPPTPVRSGGQGSALHPSQRIELHLG